MTRFASRAEKLTWKDTVWEIERLIPENRSLYSSEILEEEEHEEDREREFADKFQTDLRQTCNLILKRGKQYYNPSS